MRNTVDAINKLAKRNATTVSVIPVRDNPDARVLQRIFNLTMEEYLVLKLCASALRPSDCTATQRLLLRQLNERCLVEVIEYPCFDGSRWVPSRLGGWIVGTVPLVTGIRSDPAKVLQFPSSR
jgi:hypothetical protein